VPKRKKTNERGPTEEDSTQSGLVQQYKWDKVIGAKTKIVCGPSASLGGVDIIDFNDNAWGRSAAWFVFTLIGTNPQKDKL
jgi:hypothetical protein